MVISRRCSFLISLEGFLSKDSREILVPISISSLDEKMDNNGNDLLGFYDSFQGDYFTQDYYLDQVIIITTTIFYY